MGNREKTRQLLSLLTACYNRTQNKDKWFYKFVGVFSSEPAYEDLADIMTAALENMRSSPVTEPPNESQSKPLVKSPIWPSSFTQEGGQVNSPMQQFVNYLKDTYKQSTIERSLDILKWPPTPSKVFISLAYIDRKSDISKDEADEYTRAMIEDGNIDVVLKKKESIQFSDIGKKLTSDQFFRKGNTSGGCSRCGEVHICMGVL